MLTPRIHIIKSQKWTESKLINDYNNKGTLLE